MNNIRLPERIVDGITDTSIANIAVDIAELGFDKFLDDGFIKDIPVIGMLVNIVKGTLDIRDRVFIVKVAKFLLNLKTVPIEVRENFRNKIADDPKFKKKLGENLIVVLDRLDDFDKPEMIAKTFECYMSEKITYADFRKIASAIDSAFIDDLKFLTGPSPTEPGKFGGTYIMNLVKTGLTTFKVEYEMRTGRNEADIFYTLTPLGHLYKMIMTDDWYDPFKAEDNIQMKWKKT